MGPRRYVDEVFIPQSKELNQLYKPDLIWSDGDWEANSSCTPLFVCSSSLSVSLSLCLSVSLSLSLGSSALTVACSHPDWKSTELLAWMYNEAPNRDTVVVNDRWGAECSLKHGGYYSGADRQVSILVPVLSLHECVHYAFVD